MSTTRRLVQVEVDRAGAEIAADVLWLASPSAVAEEDLATGRVRLTADVVGSVSPSDFAPGSTVVVLEVDAEAHLDEWRRWARPIRAGRHLVVHPAWLPRTDDGPADVVVVIDPGRAFGSGSHPTTQLVLAIVEEHLRPGALVLDVGSGSGVLSVAAALLGASKVVAIDVDREAVRATGANALENEVAHVVGASTTPLEEVEGGYDLVLANIGASVLADLADALVSRLGPSGVLVLSGLLEEQTDAIVTRFDALREISRATLDGWVASTLGVAAGDSAR